MPPPGEKPAVKEWRDIIIVPMCETVSTFRRSLLKGCSSWCTQKAWFHTSSYLAHSEGYKNCLTQSPDANVRKLCGGGVEASDSVLMIPQALHLDAFTATSGPATATTSLFIQQRSWACGKRPLKTEIFQKQRHSVFFFNLPCRGNHTLCCLSFTIIRS